INYHEIYRRRLEISDRIEAYIQSLVFKKTLESMSLDFRRNGDLEELLREERSACSEPKLEKTELGATLKIAKELTRTISFIIKFNNYITHFLNFIDIFTISFILHNNNKF
ncbi:hypothetical protein NGRA_1157, partial [Nosema granulosis]